MKRYRLFSLALIGLVCVGAMLAHAAAPPNFSGVWVMDKNRSFNNPAGLEQTMTVAHEGDQLKLEAKLLTAQGERVINESYRINGQEEAFTPPAPPNAKGVRKSYWLPDGRRLIVDEVVKDEAGKQLSQTMRKWSLSADGQTLTVEYFIDNPRGSYEAKRIFMKK
jgi:hypothetical protein